jgi:transcription elongation factor GreA-like protein/transcription elongation GreA/GreB family factor
MSYLQAFRERIAAGDYTGFLKLWEEYCYSDEPNGVELKRILEEAKNSDLSSSFGQHVNRAIPLWREIQDASLRHEIIKAIFDIQTTNSEELAEIAYLYLQEKYPEDPLFEEKLKLIGLRTRENFQGAISKYDLLSHIGKGKFVFHKAGWGTGEILDFSLVREEITLEFDFVMGPKQLSYENAMKTLLPLSDDHFLARRFGNPDLLEKEAKEAPAEVVYLLLKDLGPKTASDIKEELCCLVIPEEEWPKWWQLARTKLKRDTRIICPDNLKEPFLLREGEVSHEEALYKSLEAKPSVEDMVQMIHSYFRDFSKAQHNQELKSNLEIKLKELLTQETLFDPHKIQISLLLEEIGCPDFVPLLTPLIENAKNLTELVKAIEILAFKKRFLSLVQKIRKDWQDLFFSLFFTLPQNTLRDFLFHELESNISEDLLKKKIEELLSHTISYPHAFVWYFQRLIEKKSKLPFNDTKGQSRFFENFLILLDHLDQKVEFRDLIKKMVHILTVHRYQVVQQIMPIVSDDEVKEFLLLSTKCRQLSDSDIKIIRSLAEVSHPAIKETSNAPQEESEEILWTLAESYARMKKKIEKIATVETIQNAKEIEEARAHGDLRENAEFKAALEKRARLQTELQTLSNQMNQARILTTKDIDLTKAGVGTVVECLDQNQKKKVFTILGPWEANPEKQILSFQSKLAKSMNGLKVGQSFEFQGELYTISSIQSALA